MCIENPMVLANGNGITDPQEDEVVHYCGGCGGEIFIGNEVWAVHGDLIHRNSDCAEKYVQEIGFPQIAKEEEEQT
ncbi:hypothetical protein [Fictibacillus nanhaiensis]|uniref:hypothetical protein n=1 Tax=Fictibacillus nanhaiensis TaxID=742169 RepID=UPI003C20A326